MNPTPFKPLLLAAVLTVAPQWVFASDTQPLAGTWGFALDPKGAGETEKWFSHDLADTVTLPGTVAQNRKGPQANAKAKENVMELSSEYPYEGVAWYQRAIQVPAEWQGLNVELFVERTKLTKVWLDEVCLGGQDALGVPQVYQLGQLPPGPHRLTVRVDSKTLPPAVTGHMANTSTQTKWNGLLGDLHLAARGPVGIQSVRVIPDVANRSATVTLTLSNLTALAQSGKVVLEAKPFNVPEAKKGAPVSVTTAFTVAPGGASVSLVLPLGAQALLWDEFHPALYRLEVTLQGVSTEGKPFQQTRREEFGLRDFKTQGGQFTVNGRVTMLRGKHDALVFPLLGHPPMDVESWVKVLTVAKDYGINHYRFHTCTPPDAAFAAADRVGIYMQPELYNGNYLDETSLAYSRAEGLRILSAYANHPSFVMLSLGNEMFEGRENRARLIAELRQADPSRLYAQGSNNEFSRPKLAADDDYWTTVRTVKDSADHAVRGSFAHADLPLGHIQRLRPATTYDYREAIKGVPVPVIGHEVGQFEVSPDFRELPRYTGVQKPWNLETFRRRLQTAGMLDQAGDFMEASGALTVQCYREDIEAALRTPGFGGFQLLDLQDYPGQGTALVGILNAFMESKGLISPEAWRQFCGPVVPLAKMESYTWTNSQTFSAKIDVAQYGPVDLKNQTLTWNLVDARNRTVAQGKLPAQDYTSGLVSAGTVTLPLAGLPSPARYQLQLSLGKTAYQNSYPLWLYPDQVNTTPKPAVTIRQTWDRDTQALLLEGKTVLLVPLPEVVPGMEGFFATDFWCYPMFRNCCEGMKRPVAPGTLGLWIDARHPALAGFPTASHSDWQWWDLVMGSRALVLDATPASYRPIVQGIDNFERNHKLGYLFEAKVGQGRLIVCSLDLLRKSASPVARQMLHSLLDYAAEAKAPRTELTLETVNAIFAQPAASKHQNPDGSFSEFFNPK